ncbi:hypothetical protein [Bacillus atrophaeus]|uniref:hypothetical protein n=1 Tax=Bacillus atrophaeus TaxID=1452 RepID=UPI002281AE71|nr:hypothetical protein [Bacillus atrophaeus]MCY7865939.1 hypothetical protein [Bacillus spizizenii]MCY8890500.1 hypothetical protein [Bacillus spizizenii]MEC0841955.1 hypothetical protein [Bacillus spizizenii]MED1125155.1 hypothetical protein [Bacillus atrophaeus]
MSRLTLKTVPSITGNCLIITDNTTGKNVEIMAAQMRRIVSSVQSTGSMPHGGWKKEEEKEKITIYHNDNRDKHEVTFSIDELLELLRKNANQ